MIEHGDIVYVDYPQHDDNFDTRILGEVITVIDVIDGFDNFRIYINVLNCHYEFWEDEYFSTGKVGYLSVADIRSVRHFKSIEEFYAWLI